MQKHIRYFGIIHKTRAGFSLIEMSIFVVFFGLFVGFLTNSYTSYETKNRQHKTQESIDLANKLINFFYSENLRYPCPADPRLGPGDADYGVEDCTGLNLPADPAGVANDQLIDLDNDGTGEEIMAGSFPFVTIEQSLGSVDDARVSADLETIYAAIDEQSREAISLDAYGNKLTYVVTRELADPNYPNPAHRFDPARGAILIVDEFRPMPIIDFAALDLDDERLVHYALISHGADGEGAYTHEGNVVSVCVTVAPGPPPVPPPPPVFTNANQKENCDISSSAEMDAAFVQGLYNTAANSEYDDVVRVGYFTNTEIWQMVDVDKIMALNSGNVGVGVVDPQFKLDIGGGNLQADALKADDYCDAARDNCMQAELIGGESADMQCPVGQVIRGIYENMVHCEVPTIVQLNTTCPPGEFLRGIRISSGSTSAICEAP